MTRIIMNKKLKTNSKYLLFIKVIFSIEDFLLELKNINVYLNKFKHSK